MSHTVRAICLTVVLTSSLAVVGSAQACPMCKTAMKETQDVTKDVRPQAYMYSILFMLSMPMTLATIGGTMIYRLAKQQQLRNAAILDQYGENADSLED